MAAAPLPEPGLRPARYSCSVESVILATEPREVNVPLSMSDVCLYVHTGGTTAVPKICIVSHRQMVWNSFDILATGIDPRGTQPTPGNLRGGLSTLEEKSLGGVLKTGTRPLQGVLDWGGEPEGVGLWFMDCPANVPQLLLGWAAAGAQLLVFSVGGGLPARIPSLIGCGISPLPILPVIKLLSNPKDRAYAHYFDVNAGSILEGVESVGGVARSIEDAVLRAASGERTRLETYRSVGTQVWELYVEGPTV